MDVVTGWSTTTTITTYARMYVVESIVSTSGGVMGAKAKYQYPFNGQWNALVAGWAYSGNFV